MIVINFPCQEPVYCKTVGDAVNEIIHFYGLRWSRFLELHEKIKTAYDNKLTTGSIFMQNTDLSLYLWKL